MDFQIELTAGALRRQVSQPLRFRYDLRPGQADLHALSPAGVAPERSRELYASCRMCG